MLWIEKYKPKSFSEITTHLQTVEILNKYTVETIPNLIIHGQVGHNKKTMLYACINHLYGKYPEPKEKTAEIEAGTSKLTVSYLESDEMIEICPSEYGYKDRIVVQGIIKEMAQSRPISSFFGPTKRSVKILVIDQAEDLSRDAQAALRRTMEVYSGHFRVIMLCTETSKLIEPIRSRCLMIRMRGFTKEELKKIAQDVIKKEQMEVSDSTIDEICSNSNGDCKRALCLLELHCMNTEISQVKRVKTDYSQFKLEWESRIESIAGLIKKSPKPETMLEVRKEFYALLGSSIPASIIILYLSNAVMQNCAFETCKTISTFALGYEERIRQGSKVIYHLEGFAASCMVFLNQKK